MSASSTINEQVEAQQAAPLPVGCDDGHYGIKVCAGPDVFFTLPSRAAPGRLAASTISGVVDENLVYETAPGEYVTITADDVLGTAVETRTNDYPTSSPNRALVYHALRCAGINQPITMVTGLPVNRFYLNGERNTELIEAKRESLMRPVTSLAGASLARVRGHKVISEAVASYYDALLDFDGNFNEAFKEISDEEPIAVVDAGGKTLDIATVKEGGAGIYPQQSGTADAGALYLYDLLNSAFKRAFQLEDAVPFHRLQKAISSGRFRLYGEHHDVRAIVDEQLDAFAHRVAFEVKKLLGDASRFGKVLFVGGGANLLSDRLERVFPGVPSKAITVSTNSDDPRVDSAFANARGMYKAALMDSMQ